MSRSQYEERDIHSPLTTGAIISHYRILSELGAGGMGEVYLAEDTQLGRRVAIKFLPPDSISDENARKRLVREARAAATLDHPNICSIYEVGEADGRSFIVMQYVEGETLDIRMKQKPLDLSESLSIATQVADALAEAHAHGIIHRDIKPSNVIVTARGQAKVMDFGLAKTLPPTGAIDSAAATQSLLTTPGAVIGTVPYMSPEQVRGEQLDSRSDIFSFGTVLYEMISGRQPFASQSSAVTASAILTNQPPPLARFSNEVPRELERIVAKALCKSRDERYQTIKDLLLDLKRLKQELEFEAKLERSAQSDPGGGTMVETGGQETGGRQTSALSSSSSSVETSRPNNLPARVTPLIGREAEEMEIKRFLRRDDVCLLTLTGAGGTGKTGLALQVAAKMLDEFEDGVFFISLASINAQALVAKAIAQTVGVKEVGSNPILESLKEYLRNKQLLLVLDNFEQVLGAAPLIAELLTACPRLKVLVTSRAVLRLRGEQEFAVSPLKLPDLKRLPPVEILAEYPAVALFVQRVRGVNPEFVLSNENAQAIAEICSRLDGLPLAIELAAARIKVLSPQAMLARLQNRLKLLTGGARDLPERQKTMRGAIAWSHELLEEDEKILFRRLSLFVGGCTLEAAEAVCDAAGELESDIMGLMASLVDKSLLRREEQTGGEPRFTFLETIREYGLECLRTSGEGESIRRDHANFFLGLTEKAAAESLGPNQEAWLDRLEIEHDNLRAAIEWAVESRELETGLRLGGALWRFWWMRSYLVEGRARLDNLLALTGSSSQNRTKPFIKVLYAAGVLADAQGNYRAARRLFEENLAINRELQDRAGIANSLNNLGIVAVREQDYDTARSLYEESLTLWRELGQKRAVALSLDNLGNLACAQGDFRAAHSLYEEGLAIFRELDDKRGVAASLNHLADLARNRGDGDEARSLYEESLALFLELGNKWDVARAFTDLGNLAREQGDYTGARHLYEESMVIFGELGDVRGIAYLLESFMSLAAAQNQSERALRLAGAAAILRERYNLPLPPAEQVKFEQTLMTVKHAFSESESVWMDPQTISVEQAIEYALST